MPRIAGLAVSIGSVSSGRFLARWSAGGAAVCWPVAKPPSYGVNRATRFSGALPRVVGGQFGTELEFASQSRRGRPLWNNGRRHARRRRFEFIAFRPSVGNL